MVDNIVFVTGGLEWPGMDDHTALTSILSWDPSTESRRPCCGETPSCSCFNPIIIDYDIRMLSNALNISSTVVYDLFAG